MTELRFPDLGAAHPLNNMEAEMFRASGFEPRLTFAERCGVLAFHLAKVSVPQLAAAFGVNRRTINKIIATDGNKYRNVREEYQRLGETDFLTKYATAELAAKIAEARSKPEAVQNYTEYDAAITTRKSANRRANGQEGITVIKEERHEHSHRIEVGWLAPDTAVDTSGQTFEHPEGWYWRDLDGDSLWMGDPENGTHFTSAKTLAHAKEHC